VQLLCLFACLPAVAELVRRGQPSQTTFVSSATLLHRLLGAPGGAQRSGRAEEQALMREQHSETGD